MDRQIPKETLRKEKRKRWIKYGSVVVGSVAVVAVLISLMRETINVKDLRVSSVDRGTIEVSVSASGKVAPLFEETIIAPIASRIEEVYMKAGDSVEVGTPLLRLDLQSIETEYNKMLDELQMRTYKLEQQRIKNNSALSNAEMELKVNGMKIDKMQVEVRNEKYLDSIGAGTTDKVREVQLRYDVARLEQEQAHKKLDNDRMIADAELRVQELDLAIFRKSLAETKRTLDDARILSPRKGILTFINSQVGTTVGQGTAIAILSDLSHFRVDGEIADSYGDRVATGNKVVVKVGQEELGGRVSSVTPLSKNGIIQFSVQLDEDAHPRLRSGLKTDVYVMNAVKDDVVRIKNGSYYSGKGHYELFVMKGSELVKRKVELGDSNYEFVEVISGLEQGEQVIISDMSQYRNKNKLKVSK
ncbi:ABC transporter permease [Porphyromonas cangingivalis]|uniref:ABC transporter permease n=1 Tax=Porphyromonas cangingivalis TaxID=36874 RepID=A0A0A2EIQ2_PORCN|nr:efflux RND transporter periplasmic adaptor subunit [Porphyromonas cangingivalis]KGN78803.1 ABC transporter permease [Porphyromonas cangingivalis]